MKLFSLIQNKVVCIIGFILEVVFVCFWSFVFYKNKQPAKKKILLTDLFFVHVCVFLLQKYFSVLWLFYEFKKYIPLIRINFVCFISSWTNIWFTWCMIHTITERNIRILHYGITRYQCYMHVICTCNMKFNNI